MSMSLSNLHQAILRPPKGHFTHNQKDVCLSPFSSQLVVESGKTTALSRLVHFCCNLTTNFRLYMKVCDPSLIEPLQTAPKLTWCPFQNQLADDINHLMQTAKMSTKPRSTNLHLIICSVICLLRHSHQRHYTLNKIPMQPTPSRSPKSPYVFFSF
jgi:hypothetical protein